MSDCYDDETSSHWSNLYRFRCHHQSSYDNKIMIHNGRFEFTETRIKLDHFSPRAVGEKSRMFYMKELVLYQAGGDEHGSSLILFNANTHTSYLDVKYVLAPDRKRAAGRLKPDVISV